MGNFDIKREKTTMEVINKVIIKKNSVGIFWIGQGGFIFKTPEGKIIFVDPYLSHSVEKKGKLTRLQKITLKPEEVRADLVLCTHNHLDHTDPETLLGIYKVSSTKFAGPLSVCKHMKELGIEKNRLIQINRGETKLIEGIKISAVYAKHTEDSVGYIFNFNNIIVYLTGDTEYDPKLKEIKTYTPEIMLVCINGKWGNMNIEEAVKLTKELEPKVVIPMHYGMFKENTVNPEEFIELLRKSSISSRGIILNSTKFFIYSKAQN